MAREHMTAGDTTGTTPPGGGSRGTPLYGPPAAGTAPARPPAAASIREAAARRRFWRPFRAVREVVGEALFHFDSDDGWAMASHVALQILLALFPFFIVVAALAGVIGSQGLADEVTEMVFETWPKEVAGPISDEVHAVLTRNHTSALTIGLAFAMWFSSNGVEALRMALNRAYRMVETRNYIHRRIQSLVFVVLGAVGLLSLAVLVVFGPLIWGLLETHVPWLAAVERNTRMERIVIATLVLVAVLGLAHMWLPGGRRRLTDVLPGIGFTIVAWLAAGIGFGFYLQNFSPYSNTYAGLAGVTAAIVFLYLIATIFIIGGELNSAVMRWRARRRRGHAEATHDGAAQS
ncbi:YihY/virulence factor BrkB family protein [Pseudoxanthobacter sp.]|uniref:YihY/virulence factor BrkB family protein n=1 Tax=Pseudoxanthobacter sp. TaxID=1925742 RepID=UPI002FE1BA55